jgi:hypothetical protein
MEETLISLFFLISRYVHIVATTVIVGGTLFFELVVPLAIGEMKTEVQLAVVGRMRWGFRWVVYSCTAALLLTGAVAIYRNHSAMDGKFIEFLNSKSNPAVQQKIQAMQDESIFNRPKWWYIAHLVAGTLSIVIAVSLVSGGRPPDRAVQWMRINVFILLIAIFLASASRGARQNLFMEVFSSQSGSTVHD